MNSHRISLRARVPELDYALLVKLNRAVEIPSLRSMYCAISRLGDGWIWYGVMIALPFIHGYSAVFVSLQMLVTGLVCVTLYKYLKNVTARPRPFLRYQNILASIAPLDQYSFPSGHTLHAVAFSVVLVYHYPAWGFLAIPFTCLVAISRPVLGLHYPSDVIAGALIGAVIGILSLTIF